MITVNGLTLSKDGRVTLSIKEKEESFDHEILATHGNQAFKLMNKTATHEKRNILSGFKTNKNVAILHSDLSFMPKKRVAWSARNYVTKSPFPPSSLVKPARRCALHTI